MSTCAFTGHRLLPEDFDKNLLEEKIEGLIQGGANEFLCGMAVGFDLLCAEIVLKKIRFKIGCVHSVRKSKRVLFAG